MQINEIHTHRSRPSKAVEDLPRTYKTRTYT